MIPRPITAQPAPEGLRFGNFQLCHGCSHGLHRDHVDVECACGLCADEEET